MSLLTAHSDALSARLLVMVSSRKFAKESIMKSLLLLVKRRARLLVKESINNYTYMGAVISLPLFFIYIKYGENYEKILVLNGPNLNMTGIRKKNVYGGETLKQINDELKLYGKANGAKVSFFSQIMRVTLLMLFTKVRMNLTALSSMQAHIPTILMQ